MRYNDIDKDTIETLELNRGNSKMNGKMRRRIYSGYEEHMTEEEFIELGDDVDAWIEWIKKNPLGQRKIVRKIELGREEQAMRDSI
jgi:hypothetical protein